MALGIVATGAALLGWRIPIAPVMQSQTSIYTPETIDRGRQLAGLGNCAGCHTVPGGTPYAGGLPLETPFGTVYGTNLTPDIDTGIGAWSFSAFQRAMREGLSRDGHRLYPAFPYTAFTHTSDDDLTALYAYLMTRPAVRNVVPETRLAFPFGVRPLMAAWNGLFLSPGVRVAQPGRTAQWNRGRELVDGLGHCGACHTDRNALGAERGGRAYLAGAVVDGWDAPALTSLARAPVPWTESAFYAYLRDGHSVEHGAAVGPMAPVVRALAAAPDDDVRAMAHYLASLGEGTDDTTARVAAVMTITDARVASPQPDAAQRLFGSACGACHHDGDGPRLFGVNVPLALNTKLHADRPDNLLRVILEGVREPAARDVGFMPSFSDAFDDRQVVELANYLRRRYAPNRVAWGDTREALQAIRSQSAVRERGAFEHRETGTAARKNKISAE